MTAAVNALFSDAFAHPSGGGAPAAGGTPTATAPPLSPPPLGPPPTPSEAPYPPAPPQAGERPFAESLFAAALASVPRLGPSPEAMAEPSMPGRGATPLPSAERAAGDGARAGGVPGATATATEPTPEAVPADDDAAYYWMAPPAVPKAAAKPEEWDVEAIRKDFPALQQTVHGRPLVWLDNAATTQKPRAVIEALSRFYERDNSNIHRGAHDLARRATEAYENAREAVRRFLGAGLAEEIVFVRGTTEGINLVAQTWGRQNLGPGDEVLLTTLEHHANIVPWQLVAREKGAVLKVAPVTDRGELVLEEYARLLSPRTKIAAFTHVSNALGTVLPVAEMAEMARRRGAVVLVDGAQSVPHLRANVQEIGADFFVFSGHKVFGPAGVGALYGRRHLLESMPPWQGGGSMIREVTFERTTYSDPPAKFEAGTPTIADAVGLAAAIEYVERLGMERIARREHELLEYATARMSEVPGLRMVGTAPNKASVLSFVLEGTRVEDVGRHLDSEGIAVRAGHHCAMPTMQRMGLAGTVRPSLALYNTKSDVDALVSALRRFRAG